jgi:tRNA G10  N-methylase Trm11
MFLRSISKLVDVLNYDPLRRSARIRQADCRRVPLRSKSIDAVITSPPYLNAIDYLRGHKLSLVWMGYSIPSLRGIRSTSIGTEATRHSAAKIQHQINLLKFLPNVANLPARQQNIVKRYADDAFIFLQEMQRVIKSGGQMSLVLGDSMIRGQIIENSKLFSSLAKQVGFERVAQHRRSLEESRRYLPITSSNNSLEKRMRYEVIQTYVA